MPCARWAMRWTGTATPCRTACIRPRSPTSAALSRVLAPASARGPPAVPLHAARQPPCVAALLLLAAGGPMLATLLLALRAALDASAWSALWQQPRLARPGPEPGHGPGHGLWSALALAAAILARAFAHLLWLRLLRRLGPILALPHAAFAIGLVLLLAPSGWLLRLVPPWLSGLSAPPAR